MKYIDILFDSGITVPSSLFLLTRDWCRVLALVKRTFREQTIVFIQTKKEAHRVHIVLGLLGVRVGELHGSLSQAQVRHPKSLRLFLQMTNFMPSVLWRCWLGGRKGIRPVKNLEWWGAGVVIGLEWGAGLHTAQLMPLPLTVSCFSKIQIGFTFLVPAYPDCPGEEAVKWL